jgi:hypothetical protein
MRQRAGAATQYPISHFVLNRPVMLSVVPWPQWQCRVQTQPAWLLAGFRYPHDDTEQCATEIFL